MNKQLTKLYTYSDCNKNFNLKVYPKHVILLQSVSMYYSISNLEWNGLEPIPLSDVQKYAVDKMSLYQLLKNITALIERLFINL
jgi:hypothetical protein